MSDLAQLAALLQALAELAKAPAPVRSFNMDANRKRYLADLATLDSYPERDRGSACWTHYAQDHEVANAWKRTFGTPEERDHMRRLDETREEREINELVAALAETMEELQ